ncbi:MAG: hypothetical protein WC107_01875 [Patescibacteria group bacterium]
METALLFLKKSIAKFADTPFFLLAPAEQKEIKDEILSLFTSLKHELEQNDFKDTDADRLVAKVILILSADTLNEYRLFDSLFDISLKMTAGDTNRTKSEKEFAIALEKGLERSKPFWLMMEQINKNCKSVEEIKEITKKVLGREMQIYALDYFLSIYKLLSTSSLEEQKRILLKGHGKLPALIEDGLADDMLIKVVYNLYDQKLLYRMMVDYYAYKKVFLDIGDSKLDEENIKQIILALKKYCLSLVLLSKEYEVENLTDGLYFPYGQGISIDSLIKELR